MVTQDVKDEIEEGLRLISEIVENIKMIKRAFAGQLSKILL